MSGGDAVHAIPEAQRGAMLPGGPRMISEWLGRLPANSHSRRVAVLKLALPGIGLLLLLLVMAWPRLAPLFDHLRVAPIDLREARELRMIDPRYAGTDRSGQPFVVTAAVGRQVPRRDDVFALDQPVAHLKGHDGANIVVTADSGVYQTRSQFLDAFGHVTLHHENGTTIVTSYARIDAANNAADGNQPVEGHGPQGDITAQGFKLIDKGAIVFFNGHSNALFRSTKAQVSAAAAPPSLPAPVAEAAAQIEAKAEAAPLQPAPPAAPVHRHAARPAGRQAAAEPHRTPAHPKSPPKKAN